MGPRNRPEWLRVSNGLKLAELREKIRGDLRRASVGWAISKRTTMPQAWIAEQLGLSSSANVSQARGVLRALLIVG